MQIFYGLFQGGFNARTSQFCFVLFLLPSLFLPLHGQRIESIQVDDGLSQGYVRSICHAQDGYVWIATLDGLNRYDGKRIKTYRHNPEDSYSLPSNWILEIVEDSFGQLWVLTEKGLVFFDRKAGKFYKVDLQIKGHLHLNKGLHALTADERGDIWLAAGGTVYRIVLRDGKTMEDKIRNATVRSFSNLLQATNIFCLLAVDTAMLVSTNSGLATISFQNEKIHPFSIKVSGGIFSMWRTEDKMGLWIRTKEGLALVNRGLVKLFDGFEANFTSSIKGFYHKSKMYWFGLTKVYCWDGTNMQTLDFTISQEIISASLHPSGILWLGTNAHGAIKISLDKYFFPAYGLGSSIRSIVSDGKDRIWVCPINNSGYFLFNPEENFLKNKISTPTPDWMAVGRDGALWGASNKERALLNIDPENGKIIQKISFPGWPQGIGVDQIHVSPYNNVWFFTTDLVLRRWNTLSQKAENYDCKYLFGDFQNVEALCIYEDQKNRVWVGTTNGLLVINFSVGGREFSAEVFRNIPGNPQTISNDCIFSILPKNENNNLFWIGTQHGLNLFDTDQEIVLRRITVEQELPNDVIYSMQEDDRGRLWIGTNLGLIALQPDQLTWQHYSMSDGLPATEFNTNASAKLSDGRLVFGTVNGLTVFHPNELIQKITPPKTAITGLLVNQKRVEPGNSDGLLQYPIDYSSDITLQPGQNSFALEFSCLDYGQPKGNQYQYQLAGLDRGWVSIGHRSYVNYAGLGPGKYVFRVRSSTDGEVWGGPVELSILILAPWWRRKWAIALAAFLISGLFFLIFMVRVHQYRLNDRVLLEQKQSQHWREVHNFQTRIYANMTHELRTPLTVLVGLIRQMNQELSGELKKRISVAQRQAEGMINMVDQMLDLVRIENKELVMNWQQVNVSNQIKDCVDGFAYQAQQRNIKLIFLGKEKEQISAVTDPLSLNMVVTNLISNALKFTPSGGTVKVALESHGKLNWTVCVEDTGVGIAPENLERIFDRFFTLENESSVNSRGGTGIGLAYVNELVGLLGGSIKVQSQMGAGSKFELVFPLSNEIFESKEKDIEFQPKERSSGTQRIAIKPDIANEHQLKVLVVEDHTDMAAYVASLMENDYAVHIETSGNDAWEYLLEAIPDIVISDVMMPNGNGWELCRKIKTDRRTSHIPVILLTALHSDQHRLEGLTFGADVYLAKPFDHKELKLHVKNLLSLRKAMQLQFALKEFSAESSDEKEQDRPKTHDEIFLEQVFHLIEINYSQSDFGIEEMRRELAVSPSQLHRKMTALTGRPAGYYLRQRRLDEGKRLLIEEKDRTVSEIAYRIGFKDPNYFSQVFTQRFGMPPTQFRTTNQDEENGIG